MPDVFSLSNILSSTSLNTGSSVTNALGGKNLSCINFISPFIIPLP